MPRGVRTMQELSQALFPVGVHPRGKVYRASTNILARIALFSSASTRLALLRVNARFFDVAGAVIYDTVYIDNDNWVSFFSGSLTEHGVDDTLSDCAFVNGGATSGDKCKQALTSSYRLRQNARVPHPRPPKTPVHRSFKAHLMKFVRVLTVGTHHVCLCERFGMFGARLFPNVEILRIAPCIADQWTLHTFCDNDALCHFVTTVHPAKIVFRNLDGTGFPFPPLGEQEWKAGRVKSVVLVLPTDGRRYNGSKTSAGGQPRTGTFDGNFLIFKACFDYRIVLHGEWEDNKSKKGVVADPGPVEPMSPDDLCIPLGRFIGFDEVETCKKLQYKLYGLEHVQFNKNGVIANAPEHMRRYDEQYGRYKKASYNPFIVTRYFPLHDQNAIQMLVRHELRTKSISSSIDAYFGPTECDRANLMFQPHHTYMAHVKARRGEINATD